MNVTEILAFTLVASLLVMSPGPNGVLIAKTVPTSGRRAGFANVAGFVTAFYVHGALSVLGISILITQSATAFAVAKYVGAAYLVWIGIKALISASRGSSSQTQMPAARQRRSLFAAFIEGFLTNALNPKVSMFYLAAFPQFFSAGEVSALSSFVLVAIHSLLNAIWFGGMVLLLGKFTGWTRSPRAQKLLKYTVGAVFIGFGAKLASLNRV